jgi:cobalt-zinc-cadmium efflux system outer membrane protein
MARALGAALLLSLLSALPVTLPVAQAQPAPGAVPVPTVLSLERLLADVRAANPTLRAARLEAQALATRPRQVSALPDPSFGISYRPFAVGGFDGVVPGQVAFQQMIPFPGKLRLAGEAAAYGAEMAALETNELLLDLTYQAKESYFELFRIQEQDRLIEAFQAQLDDFEKAAAAKYEVGTGLQQAILKAQLEKNTLARQRLDLSAMRRMHVERLARLTNQPDLAARQGQLALERPFLAPRAADPSEALLTRPEVKALQAGLSMADAEIAMARREYLPDFMVGAGIMDMMGVEGEAMPLDNLGRRFGIEFGVVIPLQRGKRDAAVKEARLRRQQYEARLEAARTMIKTEFNDLQNRLAEDRRALDLYEQTLVPQAETTLEATLSAYTTGRTDFLDLLDAERMLFDLKMDYEETYADYVKTRAGLDRVLGTDTLPVATR